MTSHLRRFTGGHPSLRRLGSSALLALLLCLVGPADGRAQGPPSAFPSGLEAARAGSPGDTVWVTPRSRFEAGFLQRLFLGDGYRELWSLPFPVEILDLEGFEGGLTPIRRGGGLQTPSLRLQSGTGPVYTFRSLDKDPTRALDPELRESLAAEFAKDFVSALLPLGSLILDPIQEAAGVLHASPRLALMPDDPRLEGFREDFAGVLGWIEVRADEGPDGSPGFAGSAEVKGSEPLLDDLEDDPRNRVNARAYLKARLIDGLVGDWDRHPDQWRWAGFEDEGSIRFDPVPRDRDWALTHLDGIKMWVSQIPWPHYVGFGHDYPSPFRLTWSGRVLDRRILPDLVWEDWEDTVEDLMSALPDPVIDGAVRRLPDSHYEVVGPALAAALKNRRDRLPGFARAYYLLQAETVDIRGTDQPEQAIVDRLDHGGVRVTIVQTGQAWAGPEPWYQRTFHPDETDEVRIYLHGGDDEARVRGVETGPIGIVIVGGGGDDHLSVAGGARGGGVRFFDHRGDNEFAGGPETVVDRRPYQDPHDWREDSHWAGTRDWGSRTVVVPSLIFAGDGGLVAGASLLRTGFGFRHFPHQDLTRLTLAYGARTRKPHAELEVEFPVLGQQVMGHIHALGTGARVHRFYGFGNESDNDQEPQRYQAFSTEYRLQGSVVFRLAPRLNLRAGGRFSLNDPTGNPGTVLAEEEPYGFERFSSLAVEGALAWDGRDNVAWPRRGSTLGLTFTTFPGLGSVKDAFSSGSLAATAYATAEGLPSAPTLAVQIRGVKVWGDYPYQEGAALGGSQSLRGFPERRFLGDASLTGGAEARLHLGTLPKLLPGSWGFTLSGESGRVWLEGEDSDRWRNSIGAGAWASIMDAFTLTLSVARSDEGTRFLYGGGGFHF